MLNKMSKKLFIALFALVAVLMFSIVTISAISVKAENTNFVMKETAEVRLDNKLTQDVDETGIRFTVEIDKEYLSGLTAEGGEYQGYTAKLGAAIIPTEMLGGAELDATTQYIYNGQNVPTLKIDLINYDEGESVRTYKAVVVDIPSINWETDLSARGYIQLEKEGEETVYIYTDTTAVRSIGYVTTQAYFKDDVLQEVRDEYKKALEANLGTLSFSEEEFVLLPGEQLSFEIYGNKYGFKLDKEFLAEKGVSVVSKNEDVAIVEDNVVKAVGSGVTEISLTVDGITVAQTVMVADVVKDSNTYIVAKNRSEDFTYDLSSYGVQMVGALKFGETVISSGFTFDATSGILTVPKTAFPSQEAELMIAGMTADNYLLVNTTVKAPDYAIGSKDELGASDFSNPDQSAYYVLTANIDMAGGAIRWGETFKGILDGNGYTIANVTTRYEGFDVGVMGTKLDGATIKNVAFTGFELKYYGAMLAGSIVNGTLIENVYIEGKTINSTENEDWGHFAGLGYYIPDGGAVVKNVILRADASARGALQTSYAAYDKWGGKTVYDMNNFYYICEQGTAIIKGMENPANTGVYNSMADFRADSQELSANFSNKYWEVYNGTLIFKSVKDIIVDESGLEITNGATQVAKGDLSISTNIAGATISLKNAVEGITLNGNVVSIASSVEGGTKFTVVATYYTKILGTVLTAEKEFEVISNQTVIDEKNVQIIAKDKTVDFAYDISEYQVDSIKSVTFAGSNIAYTFESNVVSIARTNFASKDANVIITALKNGDYYVFNVPVKAPDYTIETAQDFSNKGFANNNQTAYYLMLDNVDCNNSIAISWNGLTFKGTLDGNGYTLTKPHNVGQGAFYVLDGATVRNISIVGINLTAFGGLLAEEIKGNSVIENVYIEGKTSADSSISDDWAFFGGLAYSVSETTTVNNVVVVADASARGTTQTVYPLLGRWGRTDTQGISNVYYICAQGTTVINGADNPANTGVYGSQADFDAAVANQTVKLDSPYWQIVDGTYVIKPIA